MPCGGISVLVLLLLLLSFNTARVDGDGRAPIGSSIRGKASISDAIAASFEARKTRASTKALKPGAVRLVLLRNNSFGAKCLDGSPPGYYIRRGRGAGGANWHVHLPVGGWCGDERSCTRRSLNPLGSTTHWAARAPAAGYGRKKAYPAFSGLLSSNAAVNPAFHTWNLVRLVYCDGGGYTGTRGRIDVGGNKSLYLDGWNIMQAVLQDLREKRGMAAASRILLSGSSAGGQAVVMLCDRVAAAFPAAYTKCFSDAAFLADAKDRFGQYRWRDNVQQLASFHQINIPPCPRDSWMCFFPQYALPTVTTPIFIYQALFDLVLIPYGNQLGQNSAYNTKCLRGELFQQRPNVSQIVERKLWDQHVQCERDAPQADIH
ncbi:unnamed protein product [Closterium sp. Yama58-4]|nr:unnamed protein product [Closterium sp. Yama58-4]